MKKLFIKNSKKKHCIMPVLFSLVFMLISMLGLTQTAYITNTRDNTVSVIDIATNTVVDTINVGTNPKAVSVSPDGSKVYFTNTDDHTVGIINSATNTPDLSTSFKEKEIGIANQLITLIKS